MDMIFPIMLATTPIWFILGFIAWLIARDYEEHKRERFRRYRNENMEAKGQYLGFEEVEEYDSDGETEECLGTGRDNVDWLGYEG